MNEPKLETKPAAWLHTVTNDGGETTDLALSFEPDNFPLKGEAAKGLYESLCHEPLYRAVKVPHRVMVCGVDCHQGDAVCNGYCIGKADQPPPGPDAGT